MLIIPAIDLLNGQCVRLHQGDYAKVTAYHESPLEQARIFEAQGITRIHMVDLDGAKEGKPVNRKAIEEVCSKTGLMVEAGGGIRTLETCALYLELGVKKVILGTALVKNPELAPEALAKFGAAAVIAGIDFRGEQTAVSGWLENAALPPLEFALKLRAEGMEEFIFTDISKDGTLTGPNIAFYQEAGRRLGRGVIASGGVSGENDLKALSLMAGVSGVVVGKAYYEGRIDLKNWTGK